MHLIKNRIIGAGMDIVAPVNTLEVGGIKLFGVESYMGEPLQEYKARTHLLRGLSMDDIMKLKAGLAYLEFDIHAIDHTRPTANGRWYPADEMQRAMGADAVVKQFNQGGIPGVCPFIQ